MGRWSLRIAWLILVCPLMGGALGAGQGRQPTPPPTTPQILPKPMYVLVRLREGKPDTVEGDLTQWDATTLTIRNAKGAQQLAWQRLNPTSIFNVRSRLIDKQNAEEWLELGTLGWALGLKSDARHALMTAATMDTSLRPQVDAVLATSAGSSPLLAPMGADGTKYADLAPETEAKAIAGLRSLAMECQKRVSLNLKEIDTDHFMIFTDWDEREYGFLKENVEGAYRAVSRALEVSPRENIFLGKLPIFMLAKRQDFLRFAVKINHISPDDNQVSGYYAGASNGLGYMVMPKPEIEGNGTIRDAERRWGYVLTHEFTHAFVARYRGTRRIPTWMNEGLAETVASRQFPKPGYKEYVRQVAQTGQSIAITFEDKGNGFKPAELYPVMQSLVELLLAENPKAFLAMFESIKKGMPAEEALKAQYKCDYMQLEQAWRKRCVQLR